MTADVPGILDRSALAAPPRTLIDILRETTLAHPDASALEDADGALSYRELMARVVRTAARLYAAGVRRGDRVGIRMPSGSRELYIAILGVDGRGRRVRAGRRRRSPRSAPSWCSARPACAA